MSSRGRTVYSAKMPNLTRITNCKLKYPVAKYLINCNVNIALSAGVPITKNDTGRFVNNDYIFQG